MTRTRVKICCISDESEAAAAIRFGADAIGLVGKMPSGPGVIDDGTISGIAAATPPAVSTFLLTSETSADEIVSHWKRCGTTTIQIVDYIPHDEYAGIRAAIPFVRLVQVIHVEDENSIRLAEDAAGHVDGILLDSGKPAAEKKILGGTGRTHDWEISRKIVERSSVPVFLAGGLNPGNVRDAVRMVRPYGIDVCTGVRTGGRLDTEKLRRFMSAINDAGSSIVD